MAWLSGLLRTEKEVPYTRYTNRPECQPSASPVSHWRSPNACFFMPLFPPLGDLSNTEDSVRGRLISSYSHESFLGSPRDLATLTVEPLPVLRDTHPSLGPQDPGCLLMLLGAWVLSSSRQPGGMMGRVPAQARCPGLSAAAVPTPEPSSWSVSASLCRFIHTRNGRQVPGLAQHSHTGHWQFCSDPA